MLTIRRLEEDHEEGDSRSDFAAGMMAMTLVSLTAFSLSRLPILGEEIDLSLDETFPSRLFEQSQKTLARELRAHSEED